MGERFHSGSLYKQDMHSPVRFWRYVVTGRRIWWDQGPSFMRHERLEALTGVVRAKSYYRALAALELRLWRQPSFFAEGIEVMLLSGERV